jgi:hypothetical protein
VQNGSVAGGDPSYRKLIVEGTAQVQGKTVRVAVSSVRHDEK